MRYIITKQTKDPRYNLATEKYCLTHLPMDTTYLLFYCNERSVIIGRNQNTTQEIHMPFIEENGIHVVRRLSGGGAVYHDEGNLNFSVLCKDDGESFNNFTKFTLPVIEALQALGVNAELTGRNDICVDGKKISGNAQFSRNGRMFSHGTLLFETDLNNVAHALHVSLDKITSKGISSVRSRVANIAEFLDTPLSISDFQNHLIQHIIGELTPENCYTLSDADYEAIDKLYAERYNSWDWNFGRSPESTISNYARFACGGITVHLHIENGIIENISFNGDWLGKADIASLEQHFLHTPYTPQSVAEKLQNIDLNDWFGVLRNEEFIGLLFGQTKA